MRITACRCLGRSALAAAACHWCARACDVTPGVASVAWLRADGPSVKSPQAGRRDQSTQHRPDGAQALQWVRGHVDIVIAAGRRPCVLCNGPGFTFKRRRSAQRVFEIGCAKPKHWPLVAGAACALALQRNNPRSGDNGRVFTSRQMRAGGRIFRAAARKAVACVQS